LNAKRPKSQSSGKKKGKKTPSHKDDDMDAINLLTGAGYAQDPTRNIPCLIPTCQWLFTRHYDLNLHLQSLHNLSTSEIESSAELHLSEIDSYDPNDRSTLEAMYDQADLEWDMQRTATAAAAATTTISSSEEATPFWVGARDDDDLVEEASDVWEREQEEMRMLCDREGEWDGVLDPELRGM
jgi:hypothetical protein